MSLQEIIRNFIKTNINKPKYEGNYFGWRFRYQIASFDPFGQQTIDADLRQADDLLSLVHLDVFRDSGDIDYLYAKRPSTIQGTFGRWTKIWMFFFLCCPRSSQRTGRGFYHW